MPGTNSFNTSTGVLNWTPDYTSDGDYEFQITGTANSLSDSQLFFITVANTDRPPELDVITDQSNIYENSPITTVDPSDIHTGNDTDRDGEAITYTCYYDNTSDSSVANVNLCSSLNGSSFNTSTGVFNWTPDYSTNDIGPTWEFKITGTSNTASDSEFFVITVINVDRPPLLTTITDQAVSFNAPIAQINVNDANSSTDVDIDGDTITYSCTYDLLDDNVVNPGDPCTNLSGLTFDTGTGVLNWTPNDQDGGHYEFKVTGTALTLSSDTIFTISIIAPKLEWTDSAGNVVSTTEIFNFTPSGANSGIITETFTLSNTGLQDTGNINFNFPNNPKHFDEDTNNCEDGSGISYPGGSGPTTCTFIIEWDGSEKPKNRTHTKTITVTPTNGRNADFTIEGTN